jgi:hypothetical protein
LTSASWWSWVRQEKPSASTIASWPAARTAGSSPVGDRRRDVVVPALDAEVIHQAAAAAHGADLGARRYNLMKRQAAAAVLGS